MSKQLLKPDDFRLTPEPKASFEPVGRLTLSLIVGLGFVFYAHVGFIMGIFPKIFRANWHNFGGVLPLPIRLLLKEMSLFDVFWLPIFIATGLFLMFLCFYLRRERSRHLLLMPIFISLIILFTVEFIAIFFPYIHALILIN